MTTMWCLMFEEIEPVTVDRFTNKVVWIEGRKSARYADWRSYHETWQEAHNYLIQKTQQEIDSIRNQLAREIGRAHV